MNNRIQESSDVMRSIKIYRIIINIMKHMK